MPTCRYCSTCMRIHYLWKSNTLSLEKTIVVITGGPGFGKSSVVQKLGEYHFKVANEFAREIIDEQLKTGGHKLPWKDRSGFQQAVFARRLDFYQSVKSGELAFSDRGLPDQLAFARYRGADLADMLDLVQNYRYFPHVFITPPWQEIYGTDAIRNETYEEACGLHEIICQTYIDLNYKLVELPESSVETRAKFIINYLTQQHHELIKTKIF